MELAERLQEEMQNQTVLTIPILGGINVSESTVVSWIIIAALGLLAFLLTRRLKVHHISKRQAAVEAAVTGLQNLAKGMIGEDGATFVPYLVTVLLYIGISNIIGLFGFKPPTKDLNVTAALAVMSILLVQYATIRYKGFGKWIKGLVNPINMLENVTRPLSLCMRLFGNVLGAFVVMKLLEAVVPVGLPAIFSLYFDLFDGLLQAYVFVFLTALFLQEAVEREKPKEKKAKLKTKAQE